MRPVLTPSARRLWRDRSTLQLGRDSRAAVLAGIDEGARATLALLDGTRDRDQLLRDADELGCPPNRTADLLTLLEHGGLLEDAARDRSVLAELDRAERERLAADLGCLALLRGDSGLEAAEHRRGASVLVLGGGRVGAPLAALLAAAGTGAVAVVDVGAARPQDAGVGGLDLADVGQRRGDAATERLRATSPSLGPVGEPDLVVLAPVRSEELDAAREQLPRGVSHLLVEVRDTVGVVGPLVLPGRSACLRCLDLTRTDLDPGWPALAAQLASPSRQADACDGPLAVMVAAQAALQVLMLLDGTADPASVGGTLELALPDWRWRRRTWPVHPECGCVLRNRTATPHPPG